MYKESPPKDKKTYPKKDTSTGNDEVSPVPTMLLEQPDSFSLVATSSVPLPTQALIFSMESNIADPVSSIVMPHQNLAKFLKHVGFGEQVEAENMLKQDPGLSLRCGDLKDCAKREFKKITAFQYALWALDFHMWQMILKYLPDKQASIQVSGLKSGRWVQSQQTQVNWESLIDDLQTYIDNYDIWSYDKLRNYWVQTVGGTQLLLPAHIINEYHHPLRSFYSSLTNDYELVLPRLGVDCWIHANQPELMQLGENFAWARGGSEIALPQIISSTGTSSGGELRSEEIDKNYLKSLLLFRKEQARMLIFILSHHLKPQASSLKPQASSLKPHLG